MLDTQVFYATTEYPCPYLPDRYERRVITELSGRGAVALHDKLSHAGFRRSHDMAYAPVCADCQECKAIRVVTHEFRASRSQRRILKNNTNVTVEISNSTATKEQFELFVKYQHHRHSEGEMAKMNYEDYRCMIEETPIKTSVAEFRLPNNELIGVCLIDWVDDGLSAVYSFFDPDIEKLSLGTYMVLWIIEHAKTKGFHYVYLGYLIKGCQKMTYKSQFKPLESISSKGWVRI